MKYLFIDTNIYIQCCLLEIEGDDIGALKRVHALLDKNKVKLILPEVVRLEFPKALNNKSEQLKLLIGKHKEEINLDRKLDDKIRHELIAKLDETMQERIGNTDKVKKEIELIFNSTNTVSSIKMNNKHFAGAYKRFLSGIKPYNDNQKGEIQPDSLIIEGIIDYFKNKNKYDFYFCSLNEKDFGVKDNGKVKAHPDIEKEFEKIKYYSNLYSLLNEEFSGNYSAESIAKLDGKKQEVNNFIAVNSGIVGGYCVSDDIIDLDLDANRSSGVSFMPTNALFTGSQSSDKFANLNGRSGSLLTDNMSGCPTIGTTHDPASAVFGGTNNMNSFNSSATMSLCKGCGSLSYTLDQEGYCPTCKNLLGGVGIN